MAYTRQGFVDGFTVTADVMTKIEDGIIGAEEAASNAVSYTIPDYWQSAVDEAVTKVKALQDAGGKDVVNFLLFSDLHYGDNTAKVQYVGHLCAAMMDLCNIPLVINCGDTMTSSPLSSEAALLANLDSGTALLSPIDLEGYAQVCGNHDDVWGQYTSGSTTVSYVNKVAPAKMWNRVFRKQTKDLRRVFGGNGSFFYIDNEPQKVRFICLNSHYYDGEEVTSGTTKIMTTGFGTEQLDWLENTALNIGSDWGAVIATHVPPTASTINGNTYYLSQISDGAAFRTIISETEANLIGIFCGHCHASAIVTDDLPCPIITITTAGGVPYDSTEGTRTVGTVTETAIDIVSINKADEKINLTRLGIGSDRVCSYVGAVIVTYSITSNFANVTSSNTTAQVESGAAYTATLTAASGYELASVTVTMGGTDITSSAYSGGKVSIASVTGNVVITATATKTESEPSGYTNLADPTSSDWANNSRLNSSGEVKTLSGSVVTNWIECQRGDILRFKGIELTTAYATSNTTAPYFSLEYTSGNISTADINSYESGFPRDSNGVYTFEVLCFNGDGVQTSPTSGEVAKMRFSGLLSASDASAVIITKNEEID